MLTRKPVACDLRDRRTAREAERQVELGLEVADHLPDAAFAGDAEAVRIGPADQDCPRAERECLERVRASADAAVQEDRNAAVDRLDDTGQRFDRRDRAVDLAAAVVLDQDPVHPRVDRAAGVVRVQDALEHDR